jgi:hypothetical protein
MATDDIALGDGRCDSNFIKIVNNSPENGIFLLVTQGKGSYFWS